MIEWEDKLSGLANIAFPDNFLWGPTDLFSR